MVGVTHQSDSQPELPAFTFGHSRADASPIPSLLTLPAEIIT